MPLFTCGAGQLMAAPHETLKDISREWASYATLPTTKINIARRVITHRCLAQKAWLPENFLTYALDYS